MRRREDVAGGAQGLDARAHFAADIAGFSTMSIISFSMPSRALKEGIRKDI